MESPRICDTRFLFSTGLSASILERHDSTAFVVAKLGHSTPPHTPGILYEYQNKGVAKLAFRKPLILKDAFSVACNS